MKNVLTILLLFSASSFSIPQSQNKDTIAVKESAKVIEELKQVTSSIESDKAYIEAKSKENRERLLNEIPKLNKKEDDMLNRILKKLSLKKKDEIKKPTTTTKIVYKLVEKNNIVNNKDSICIAYKREFLGARKCVKWAYKE